MNNESRLATRAEDKLITQSVSKLMTGMVDTKTIVDLDKKHYLHPYHLFDSISEQGALPINRAEGPYIWGHRRQTIS